MWQIALMAERGYLLFDRARWAPSEHQPARNVHALFLTYPPRRRDPHTGAFTLVGMELLTQAQAELLCDQFNIRDYGEVDDGSRP